MFNLFYFCDWFIFWYVRLILIVCLYVFDILGFFIIDEVIGVIVVVKLLDWEVNDILRMYVFVEDFGDFKKID